MKYLKKYQLFEATYHADDLNVDITSTISDIFEDLTDDSDFDVSCFTIGYTTLKAVGATYTDNDIYFSIEREYYKHDKEGVGKTFTINQILPYLKRTIDYIESEGRFANNIHFQYRIRSRMLKQMELKTIDELFEYGDTQIENLSMGFVLNEKKKKINEAEYTGIFGNKTILNIVQDIKYALIDLKDDGWYTTISYRPKRWESDTNPIKSDSIAVVIKKKENRSGSKYPSNGSIFNIQDIREYVERIGNMFSDNEINSRKCKPPSMQMPGDETSDFTLFGRWGNFSSDYNELLNSKDNVLGIEMIIYLNGENIDQNEDMNESILETKEDAEYIQDIFSSVIDDGVRVFFGRAGLPNRYTIKIGEYSDQVKFKYSDISNEIEHLKSYLINDRNMRLSDVEVDFVQCNSSDVYGYGRRLEGWERLNILKEKDIEMYSMAISFVSRGGTHL